MRYACPSCKRVFYLETKTVSPCPACGTTLTMEGDKAAGAAPETSAAPETGAAGGGSWLVGGADSEKPTQATAAPVSSSAPTVQSWLTPPAAAPRQPAPAPSFAERDPIGADPSGGPFAPPPPEDDSPAAAMEALSAASRPTGPGTSGMPTGGPRTARMASARRPTGTRVFLVTSAAVFVTVAIAAGAIWFLGVKFPEASPPGGPVAPGNQEEIARLNEALREAGRKLAEEQEKVLEANKARRDLEAKLDESGIEAEDLKGRLARQASALDLVLEAQALLERHSDLESARSLIDSALNKDPDLRLARRVKGRVLAAAGLAKAALDAFEQADAAARKAGEPGDAEALILAGEVCMTDLGDLKRALEYYRRAAGLETTPRLRLAAEARLSQLEGNLDRAIAKAEKLAETDPSLALAPLIIGEVMFDQAVRAGAAAERRALLDKADVRLERALRLDPNSARGCLIRGKLLLEKSKHEGGFGFAISRLRPQSQAQRLLSDARKLKPQVPDVHLALAELSLASGALRDPAQALQSANEAVRLTRGENAQALALLAQAYAATGDPGKAVTAIRNAMVVAPKNKQYMDLLRRYEEETRSLSE